MSQLKLNFAVNSKYEAFYTGGKIQRKMDTRMLSLLYGKEAIDKAKKRGRAYLCLGCQKQKGVQIVGERGPMEDHVLKNHVARDRIPFYCRLCTFKCFTLQQMNHHVNHYSRHLARAREMNVTNHQEWMVASPVPYQIGEMDLMKFTQEESLLFFLKKQAGEQSPVTTVTEPMPVVSPVLIGETLKSATQSIGYTLESPAIGESQPASLANPGCTVGSVLQTPAPVVSLTEAEEPIPMVGGQQLQFATLNQLVTGLGLLTGQVGPTIMQQASSTTQNPGTATPMQMPITHPQSPLFQATTLGMNFGSPFQPIRTSQEVTSAFTPANPLVAAPQSSLLSSLGGVPCTTLQPSSDARSDGPSTALLPAGSDAIPVTAQMKGGQGPALPPTRDTTLPVVVQRTDALETALLPTGNSNILMVAQRPDKSTAGSRPASDLGSVEVELMGKTTPVSQYESALPRSTQKEEPEPAKDGETLEEVEDLWPQLMPQGEADRLSEAEEQDLGKRKSDEEEGIAKRRKVETPEGAAVAEMEEVAEVEVGKEPGGLEADGSKEWKKIREQVESKMGPTLEISLVAMNGLVSAIQSGNRQGVRTEKASERVEKALTDATCMLGKVVAALNGLKKAVEENTREDRCREEKWFDMERKREEEREREREAERRREDRRRDAEKKERAEIRKLICSIGEKKDSAKGEEKKSSGKGEKGVEEKDGKENPKKEIRSALGKSYTENSIRDFSKRI